MVDFRCCVSESKLVDAKIQLHVPTRAPLDDYKMTQEGEIVAGCCHETKRQAHLFWLAILAITSRTRLSMSTRRAGTFAGAPAARRTSHSRAASA